MQLVQLHIPIQSVSHPSRPVPMLTVFDSLQYSRQDQRTRSLVDPSNVLQAMSPWATYRETGQGIGGQSLSVVVWSHVNGYAIGNVRSCKVFLNHQKVQARPQWSLALFGALFAAHDPLKTRDYIHDLNGLNILQHILTYPDSMLHSKHQHGMNKPSPSELLSYCYFSLLSFISLKN